MDSGRFSVPLVALLVVWTLCMHETQCKQEFRTRPKYTEVNPEETAILDCQVSKIGGQCSWQKDRKPVRLFAQKYEWVGSPEEGQCGLRIRNASLTYDDGEWECQVTSSSFDKMDALSSDPVRLAVRVAPKEPSIEYNTSRLDRGHNLTTAADQTTLVKCLAHYGNPPAAIRWFLDEVDVTAFADQNNLTEPDKHRTWLAVSVLRHAFPRDHNGKLLRCLAFHEAYEQKSKEISVKLNIQYPPITSLHGKPEKELEESKDSLKIRCSADANPPATVTWKKNGIDQQPSDKLEFLPLKRAHSGIYMCEARNALGQSVTQTVAIDVKYAPKIKVINPIRVSVPLSNRTTLSCSAEGNPEPKYHWLHSMSGNPEAALMVSHGAILVLANTTYNNQGKYVCVASNVINEKERSVQSREVTIDVYGPPQVLNIGSYKDHLVVDKGLDAIIHVAFCSIPHPSKVYWEWGSLLLKAGEGTGGRFIAKSVQEIKNVKGCFEAELMIQKVKPSESRRYFLKVENSHGHMSHAIFLNVVEPIAMLTVIGIVIGCLVLLVVVIVVVLYAFRTEKWCFQKKDPFQTKDAESAVDRKESPGEPKTCCTGAIPPDALYTVPPKHNSNNQRSDDISEFDSMMSDHNDIKSVGNQEVVYADLDLIHSKAPSTKSKVIRRESPTEYAHIQVQYRPKPDEQADI